MREATNCIIIRIEGDLEEVMVTDASLSEVREALDYTGEDEWSTDDAVGRLISQGYKAVLHTVDSVMDF